MTKKFESAYGYFSEDGKECNIVSRLTPRPWKNAIRYGDMGMMKRIARSFQHLIKDRWEKYFYIQAFIDLQTYTVKSMVRSGELKNTQFEIGGAY